MHYQSFQATRNMDIMDNMAYDNSVGHVLLVAKNQRNSLEIGVTM